MPDSITLKDAVTLAAQVSQKVLAYKQQGYTDISVKQVNDPTDNGTLQEQVLLDMQKDGKAVEVRLVTRKREDGDVQTKETKGKVNGKRE